MIVHLYIGKYKEIVLCTHHVVFSIPHDAIAGCCWLFPFCAIDYIGVYIKSFGLIWCYCGKLIVVFW